MAEENKQLYEIGYHIIPTVAQSALEDTVRDVISIIEKYEGNVRGGILPQMQKLAYSASKEHDDVRKEYDSAYFGWMNIDVDPSKAPDLQSELRSHKSVLRLICIKKDEDDTPEGDMFDPSTQTAKKEEMEDEEIDEKIDELVVGEESDEEDDQ